RIPEGTAPPPTHARRLGLLSPPSPGRRRTLPLPLVLDRSPERPPHLLLRRLRAPLARPLGPRLPPRSGAQARSRHLQKLPRQYAARRGHPEALARPDPQAPAELLGPADLHRPLP